MNELVYSKGSQVTPDKNATKSSKTKMISSLGLMSLGATAMGVFNLMKSSDAVDDILSKAMDITKEPIVIAAALGAYAYFKCMEAKNDTQ